MFLKKKYFVNQNQKLAYCFLSSYQFVLRSSSSQELVQNSLCMFKAINLSTQFFTEMKIYNPGENIVDKFLKSSKTSFSVKFFKSDFSRFLTIKIFILRGQLWPLFLSIFEIFLKFTFFLGSKVLLFTNSQNYSKTWKSFQIFLTGL